MTASPSPEPATIKCPGCGANLQWLEGAESRCPGYYDLHTDESLTNHYHRHDDRRCAELKVTEHT
jgi:hypothetical protein